MLDLISGQIHYDYSMCQQCGACLSSCPKHALSTKELKNGLKSIVIDSNLCIRCKKCVSVCPAHRIVSDDSYNESFKNYEYYLSHNDNDLIRRAQSSGGAAKTLAIECLKANLVDGVYSLKKTDTYPFAEGEFFCRENSPSFERLPNSIYHSVMACKELYKVPKCNRLMVIGTTCQLYAAEKVLKGKFEKIIKIVIFCKQQKTPEAMRFLAKYNRCKLPSNGCFDLSYRGDGWTGFSTMMGVKTPYKKFSYLAFGRRLWTVPGCNACSDPYGKDIRADITILDPRYVCEENELGDSFLVVMSDEGKQLVLSTPHLISQQISYESSLQTLALGDVKRKRLLARCYTKENVSTKIKLVARLEFITRYWLELVVETLPRLPFVAYKILSKITPNWRDLLLR